MFSILIFFHIIWLRDLQNINGLDISPGVPVPHAEELDRILSANLLKNSTSFDGYSVFDYLFGDSFNFNHSDKLQASEHLDISILDPDTITRLVKAARRDMEQSNLPDTINQTNTTREGQNKPSLRFGYWHNQNFINKAVDLMQQSIYETRRRMQDTRHMRKKYQDNISYNIGILYGSLMQLRYKMENAYMTLKKLRDWKMFIWYLFLYQKCLALHVDISFAVKRIFELQEKWLETLNTKNKNEYASGVSSLVIPELGSVLSMDGLGMPGMPGVPGPGARPKPPRPAQRTPNWLRRVEPPR